MQNTAHPYKDILNAIAEGKGIEWQTGNGLWTFQNHSITLCEIAERQFEPGRYRVKPEVITVLSTDIPEPVRFELTENTKYYCPRISRNAPDYWKFTWENDAVDYIHLDNGLIHRTEEAAIKHAEVLLSLTKRK